MTKENSPWGIDQLNQQTEETTKAQQDALKLQCIPYAQCFGTPAGKKVLAEIRNLLDAQVWNPQLGPNYGYYREGQNDVLRHIINRVIFATKK